MTTNENEESEFYVDLTTVGGVTEVGARTFRYLGTEPGAELVLERLAMRLSTNEDMSLWQEVKRIWNVLRGKRTAVTVDVAILLDRATAIKINDELIEALYYDENGTYWNGAPPAVPAQGNEQPSTAD